MCEALLKRAARYAAIAALNQSSWSLQCSAMQLALHSSILRRGDSHRSNCIVQIILCESPRSNMLAVQCELHCTALQTPTVLIQCSDCCVASSALEFADFAAQSLVRTALQARIGM
jgi:hypothetical protein